MPCCRPVLLPVVLLLCSPLAQAQELPPTAEATIEELVAALPETQRVQQQSALKAVWLERLIRAREERHRVTPANLSHCVLLAQKLGAPAAFVEQLRRQAVGNLPARERHVLENAQQDLLAAYGVNALEIRFFVEGSGLSVDQLREVAVWLPLADVFQLVPPEAEGVTTEEFHAACTGLIAVQREYGELLQGVQDAASADAAAEVALPLLARRQAALARLLATPENLREHMLKTHAEEFALAQKYFLHARARLVEQGWYASSRLQALDYLLH